MCYWNSWINYQFPKMGCVPLNLLYKQFYSEIKLNNFTFTTLPKLVKWDNIIRALNHRYRIMGYKQTFTYYKHNKHLVSSLRANCLYSQFNVHNINYKHVSIQLFIKTVLPLLSRSWLFMCNNMSSFTTKYCRGGQFLIQAD